MIYSLFDDNFMFGVMCLRSVCAYDRVLHLVVSLRTAVLFSLYA
jgi:hypothetical protein